MFLVAPSHCLVQLSVNNSNHSKDNWGREATEELPNQEKMQYNVPEESFDATDILLTVEIRKMLGYI